MLTESQGLDCLASLNHASMYESQAKLIGSGTLDLGNSSEVSTTWYSPCGLPAKEFVEAALPGTGQCNGLKSGGMQMAVFNVTASMNVLDLNRAGSAIEMVIYSDDQVLGTMRIGKGSLGWKGKNRKQFKNMNWGQFSAMMDKKHYPE